jgi:hypothetical protein
MSVGQIAKIKVYPNVSRTVEHKNSEGPCIARRHNSITNSISTINVLPSMAIVEREEDRLGQKIEPTSLGNHGTSGIGAYLGAVR